MTRPQLIFNARLLLPDGRIEAGSLLFGSTIGAVGSAVGFGESPDAERIDARGALVTPGLVDVHIHGVGAHSFERSAADLRAGLAMLPQFGVTTVLPTLYRSLVPESFGLLGELAAALEGASGARVPGFHLEGPFLAITGAGALTRSGDTGFLHELLAACGGKVAAMSISPEVSGIVPVIERLVGAGIVPFITHTRASVEQTQAALDAGARHATHFYDVFPLPPETDAGVRPVGAVETILADGRATVDFICDGVHVHPMAVRSALAAKGPFGVIAITDANVGAGLGAGTFDTPWGYRIRIADGDAARVADEGHPLFGQIAGSGLTMDRAVANLSRWLPEQPGTPWLMATRNPAALMQLGDRGRLVAGLSGDVALWDAGGKAARVWVGGREVRTTTGTGTTGDEKGASHE